MQSRLMQLTHDDLQLIVEIKTHAVNIKIAVNFSIVNIFGNSSFTQLFLAKKSLDAPAQFIFYTVISPKKFP